MILTEEFIESLLYEEEGTTLDFKQEQYRFIKASDDEKSELLKDILAFCNAWRRTDAYILIGIKEVKGGKSVVHGISEFLDDAQLQQFVNKKTQRPVNFFYKNLSFEGKKIAVIHIPIQKRPIYLNKDFGKLKQHVVYVRRGSSTAEANPDEVASMGEDIVSQAISPDITLHFANNQRRKLLSSPITIEILVLNAPKPQDIPDYEDKYGLNLSSLSNDRYRNYYRNLVTYYEVTEKVKPVNFAVTNEGDVVANDVNLRIEVFDPNQDIIVLDEYNFPTRPVNNPFAENRYIISPSTAQKPFHASWIEDHHLIECEIGKIRPKDTIWIQSVLFVGANAPCTVKLNAVLYADNLANPVQTEMEIVIKADNRNVTFEEIVKIDQQRRREEYINANKSKE